MTGKRGTVSAHPSWIRAKVCRSEEASDVRDLLDRLHLKSVCVDAACPNRGKCWEAKHVTFMILGGICTRDCRFCNIAGGVPDIPDPSEPRNITEAVRKLALRYVVITSVTRDDLIDRGARHFVRTVREIKRNTPDVMVELLIPDLDASFALLTEIAFSGAEVIGHNIEMPEFLYPAIRPKADYRRSLDVLKTLNTAKEAGADILIKSAIMLGLGEKEEDIYQTLRDLKDAGVNIVYMGQYLAPSSKHWPVRRYYTPGEFRLLEKSAAGMGFDAVCAGPMVRSSYQAYSSFLKCRPGAGRARTRFLTRRSYGL